MLTFFVVLAHLSLLAAAVSHPHRRNVGKSMQFRKRANLTDFAFPYTNELSALSIRDVARHPNLAKRRGEPQTVPLSYTGSEQWVAVISIGHGQKFSLLVDTGSTDLWVVSKTNIWQDGYVIVHGEGEYKEHYEAAFVEGVVDHNMVAIGNLRLEDQYFGVVTSIKKKISGEMRSVEAHFPYDGILGLSLAPDGSSKKRLSFFHHAIDAGEIAPIFSIDPVGPTLYLGEINAAYTHLIEWHEVMENEILWKPKEEGYILVQGTTEYGVKLSTIDSGSSHIFGPLGIVKDIYESLEGRKINDVWTFPCNKKPKVEIKWGTGKPWQIAFNLTPVHNRFQDCEGAIQEGNTHDWTIARPFVNEVYSAYDLKRKRVGFAPLHRHP